MEWNRQETFWRRVSCYSGSRLRHALPIRITLTVMGGTKHLGLLVGLILLAGGVGICYRSLRHVAEVHATPASYGFIPLIISLLAKSVLSAMKFRQGRQIHSAALVADAWNDFIDIISAAVAMTALGLTLWDPSRFLAADHYGGFAVGVIVLFTGVSVAKESSARLSDIMPNPDAVDQIRRTALGVPGVAGVEKL